MYNKHEVDAKEEVRARLNIEDVIGEYVQLKRAGRNYKGISPFTSEKTPSFYVSPDKQIWHDFSGNKGGDVFSFIMEVEGLDFRQALELLARKAGVDLSLYQSGGNKGLAQKKQRLLSALDLAATYYQQSLLKNNAALEYVFKKRGLNRDAVTVFRIGYSPNADDALTRALTKRGFKEDELYDAGLSVRRRGRLGDMFRGRMMIPLSDGQGQVVGFTARIMEDRKDAPKYINTPQTLLYDKGRQVFGLAQAKEAIRKSDRAVVVEGNLDVVSSHQAGVANVVAAAGTALTEYHLKSLTRLSGNVALAFDGDKAGVAATERAIGLAQAVGTRLSVVVLPDTAKDPDELIQQDPALWRQAIEQAQPVVDWVISRYQTLFDITTAEGKRELTTRALTIVKQLKDPVEREHYVELIARVTGASKGALEDKLAGIGATDTPQRLKAVKAAVAPPSSAEDTRRVGYQDGLLALAASDPSTRPVLNKLSIECLEGEERQVLARYLAANQTADIEGELPPELREIGTYVKIVLLQAETRYGQWSAQDRYLEAAKLVRQVEQEKTKQKKADLITRLREAESLGDSAVVSALRSELNTLIKEEHSAKGRH